MKQHRFIGSFDLTKNHIEVRDRALAHQIANVLKLREGEEVVLGDGVGKQAIAILERVSSDSLGLQIVSVAPNENEPSARVTLYASILKHELFEWVVQKATEIGVSAIVPVIAARTVKRAARMARLRQIAKEAAEQYGRGIIPHIAEPMEFESAVEHAHAQERNFFFTIGAPEVSLRGKPAFKTAGIFVGPEGGWEEKEAERAQLAGFESAGLGALTLRAETAAVIASYSVLRL